MLTESIPSYQKNEEKIMIKILPFSQELLAIELVNCVVGISVVIEFLRKINSLLIRTSLVSASKNIS